MARTDVDTIRQEWADGYRRVAAQASDRRRYGQLLAEVDAVTAELRRRIGQTFDLAELVALYADAERWARDAVAESQPPPGWPRELAVVTDAAFHRYSRGARDYEP